MLWKQVPCSGTRFLYPQQWVQGVYWPQHGNTPVASGKQLYDGDRFNSCQVIYSQFGLVIDQNDHQARRRFVEWAQNEIAVVPDFHKRILFSDEAHIWLNGYVNKQNCRIWSEANPQVYVETPLHPVSDINELEGKLVPTFGDLWSCLKLLERFRISLPAFATAGALLDIVACFCRCWTANRCCRIPVSSSSGCRIPVSSSLGCRIPVSSSSGYRILAYTSSSGFADRNYCSDLQASMTTINSIFFFKLKLLSPQGRLIALLVEWLREQKNCRIWSEANPQVYVEAPLHPEKLTVWCALWAGGIIGPYFFKNDERHNITVNGDRYRAMITNVFIPELNNHDVQELWFQKDGATCHTARATIDLLKDMFGDRLISRFGPMIWPPRSCDLTPLDYFLWGYVKSLVNAVKSQTLDHLEDNIRRVIADIRPQMLEKVIENWTSRLDYIRASRGSPMPEFIFKM
ncbi:uncharacterized protein TNCV_545191 [Trichonephila clavipes]|nr:uncharacterized protein TNCV_545191 [Trichonephila clavipes]